MDISFLDEDFVLANAPKSDENLPLVVLESHLLAQQDRIPVDLSGLLLLLLLAKKDVLPSDIEGTKFAAGPPPAGE
ncbi:UNVERIFIED_CONTAM: hypothetical protein Slati_1376800 [Sesamum latifolium]|uniref:Uncharacterized protein n=1 Tax=Sesamum latifolium TaxID=2727402 RepID=A0AAW2XIJ0_9LAMI